MSESSFGVIPPLARRGHLALDEAELVEWGERFGRVSSPPLVVALTGDLGAGKTTVARAICRGYGVTDEVTSPTFTLVHRYAAPRGPVYHVDLYRLGGPSDLTNIGWDDLLAEDALVLVEWPERAGDRLPSSHVSIELQHLPDEPSKRLLYAGGHA